jgi:hypothetical protein
MAEGRVHVKAKIQAGSTHDHISGAMKWLITHLDAEWSIVAP